MVEATPLTAVPGIGSSIAGALRHVGIGTVEELAKADPEAVTEAEGIGTRRAARIIEGAKRMDVRKSYDAFKQYKGQKYTGVRIGRGHTWNYDPGEWKEKKLTPDRWGFRYAVAKRRKGNAPEGSGVPVGTRYNWFILAHQVVEKLDANTYSTEMAGVKYKVAHARADAGRWNVSDDAQRKKVVKLLREMADELDAAT